MLDSLWYIFIFVFIILSIYISYKTNVDNLKVINIKNINLKSLLFSLGTKLGVGSFIGTAMCILIGGYGTIFWIWILTIIFSSLTYFESYVGHHFKNDNINGPFGFTFKAFNKKSISILITSLLIITYTYLFIMIQINTLSSTININIYILSILIFFIILYLLFFINQKLLTLLNTITIIMCLIIICSCLYILIINYSFIPHILYLIIKSAFTKKGLTVGLLIAIKRSFFLNEYLIGTTSVASGISKSNDLNTCKTQTIGTFFISFVIITLISFVLILYLENNSFNINNNYISFLKNSFNYYLGTNGNIIFNILIILLSFSTIVSGIYMGINAINFFKNKVLNFIFKLSMILFCVGSIFISTNIIWYLIDLFMLIIAIFNGIAFIKLRNTYKEVKDYDW